MENHEPNPSIKKLDKSVEFCSFYFSRLAGKSNDVFSVMIFVQYSLSTIVLCVSVLQLTHMKPLSVEAAGVLMYLACMLIQIFIYCLYGGQVTVEVS